MADFVSGLVQNIIGTLAAAAYDEIILAWGVKKDLEKLMQRLETIKQQLLAAEQSQARNPEIRSWFLKLQHFCHDAENVLDEFEAEVLRKRADDRQTIISKIRRCAKCIPHIAFRFKMAHRIKSLGERIDDLLEEKKLFFFLKTNEVKPIVQRRETHSYLPVTGVFGRRDDKNRVIDLLMSSNKDTKISVIPIVGIGGIGKTTLAQMVFRDDMVRQHFEVKVWIHIDVDFHPKKIIQDIIELLSPNTQCSDWKMERLQGHLRSMLENKMCLFIFDDVWNVTRKQWIELRELLEGVSSGSKIIVTSRNRSVASIMDSMPEYNLKELSEKDSMSLFLKCAFEQGDKESYPNLVEIGKQIVKKCVGNPLAVKTLGTLLYSKNEEQNWVNVRDSEIWKMKTDILPSLRISYDLMPSYLKQCFAYCSIFPKNYEFNNLELIQLWIASGLIQTTNGNNQDLEEIGQQYWEELWSRSFFEDVVEHPLFLTFRMHDLIRQLCLSVAQNESSVVNVSTKDVYEKTRHLSLSDPNLLSDKLPKSMHKLKGLHTIMFLVKKEGPTAETFLRKCISTFKHLSVLYLHDSSFEELPSSVGNLRHLRFLHLCGNLKIRRLPSSVCELWNLQSLGLANCKGLEELPREMNRLVNLRFLDITTKQVVLPENGVGSLTSLRALFIGDCDNLEALCEDIGSLEYLRKLFVGSCPKLKYLPRGIGYLQKLESLWIGNCPCIKLSLGGSEEESFPTKDIGLTLRSLVLFQLPNLVSLPEWVEGSAYTLRRIVIEDCPHFTSLPTWLRRCSSLQKLKIRGCPQVLHPQMGMPLLPSLRVLMIEDGGELSRECSSDGVDWPRIAHIPEIYIDGEKIK